METFPDSLWEIIGKDGDSMNKSACLSRRAAFTQSGLISPYGYIAKPLHFSKETRNLNFCVNYLNC